MSTGMCCVCRSLGICEIFFFQSQKRFLGCAKVMYGDTPGISRSMSSLLATSLSLDRADTRQFLFSLRFLLLCVDRWVQFFVNLLWGPMLCTLSLSLSDIITIRPRLYFLSPLSPFSLLLTSSHQFSPILWNISPPPHARLVCLSGLKGEQSLFDRSLPRSLVVEPPGTL